MLLQHVRSVAQKSGQHATGVQRGAFVFAIVPTTTKAPERRYWRSQQGLNVGVQSGQEPPLPQARNTYTLTTE